MKRPSSNARKAICRSLTDEEIQKYKEKYSEAPDIDDEETAADVGFKFFGFN